MLTAVTRQAMMTHQPKSVMTKRKSMTAVRMSPRSLTAVAMMTCHPLERKSLTAVMMMRQSLGKPIAVTMVMRQKMRKRTRAPRRGQYPKGRVEAPGSLSISS